MRDHQGRDKVLGEDKTMIDMLHILSTLQRKIQGFGIFEY